MKKLVYSLLAISMALVSCSKENETNLAEDQQNDNTPVEVVSNGIPESITCVIPDTKTAYSPTGDFTWLSSDKVRLLVCQDKATYSKQGIYTYQVKTLSGDSKTAVFTSTSSAGDLTAFADGTWKSTGYAMYPTTILDRFDTPEAHSYGAPWFTLAQGGNVSGSASDIILIGINDNSISNFHFYTAMSVLKVTLNDIPENAAAVKLCTSDKTNYPVDGDFSLSTVEGRPTVTFIPTYVSGFKGYQKIDISSEGEIASVDYYFNIPAATYPANTLSIVVEDANGGKIMKRTLSRDLTLARNDCLDLPDLTVVNEAFVGGNVTTPRFRWNFDAKKVIFAVNQTATLSDSDLAAFPSGYVWTSSTDGRCTYVGSSYPEGYGMTSLSPNPFTTNGSGKYYMHYVILSSDSKPSTLNDPNVVTSGTAPFYYISSADVASFVGTLSCTYTDGGASRTDNPANGVICHPGTGSGYDASMTLATSDDISKGNIMLTYLYKQTRDTGRQLYGVIDNSTNKVVFPYPGDTNQDYFFKSWNSNYFHIASCETVTFSGSTLSSTANGNLEFTIGGSTLTHANYLMMKYTGSYSSWDAFVYGKGLVFTK